MDPYTPPKYEGWGAFDKTSTQGNFKWFEYEPKKWAEDDVESESHLILVPLLPAWRLPIRSKLTPPPFFPIMQSRSNIAEFVRLTTTALRVGGSTWKLLACILRLSVTKSSARSFASAQRSPTSR